MRIAFVRLTLLLLFVGGAAQAQRVYPAISERQFTGGSITVTVSGGFSINEEIAINTKASMSSGSMTWLQFGTSGAPGANALLTLGSNEVGVTVALGKRIATAGVIGGEKPQCLGSTDVKAALISGQYTCKGITSYDPASGKMGTVDIDVRFTARS
jgi:hypothetical protein